MNWNENILTRSNGLLKREDTDTRNVVQGTGTCPKEEVYPYSRGGDRRFAIEPGKSMESRTHIVEECEMYKVGGGSVE